jgi:two-component system, NarL family, sensor kinase
VEINSGYIKQLLLIVAIVAATHTVSGQTAWEKRRDSLLQVLGASKEDTGRVWAMLWLGVGYLYNQPDSAAYYGKAMCKLSGKLHFPNGMANGLSLQAVTLSNQEKQDEAIALDLEAIEIAKKANSRKTLANIYNNIAIVYSAKQDHSSTLEFYLKAAAIYESGNDSSSMAFIYSNISEVYDDLKEFKSGYEYSEKGIALCRKLHQTHGLGAGMVNLSTALINFQRFDTALIVLRELKELAKRMNDVYEMIDAMTNIDCAYKGLGQFDPIKANAGELMAIAKSIDDKNGMCYALYGLTDYYFFKKKYAQAEYYADQAIGIAEQNKLVPTLRDAYKEAAQVELARGNISRYYRYNSLQDSINDALFSDKILRNTQELDAKYSLNKKQIEIDDLNKQEKIQQLTIKQRNTMNWALISLVFVIGLIGLSFNWNYRQKKKLLLADALLQQERIVELEREKQFLAAQAMLQGQVEERTRMAKDLHDGLGSILSSAKYSFTNMKDNLIITPENAEAFERSMGMLDRSINELRRVAHNMMPEALVKFGLDTALKDYCNSIDQSGAVQLTYQSFGIDELSISKSTSSAVYRMVQELVNNILKHANGTTALVQLIRKNDALSITVEDNGKGFDTGILQNNNGMGYLNLRNRVTYLNGTIDIQTAVGKGTSVNIEISNVTI